MAQVDTREWKEFHLYDIFDIEMGNKMDRSKMSNGDIAFVGRTAYNNGINARVNSVKNHDKYGTVEPYKSGCLTLALGGSIGSCFLQEEPFYTSQNVAVLMPRGNESEHALRFIASVITHSVLYGKYEAFTEELNKHIKTDFAISLPATSEGQPDWDYMDSFMQKIFFETEASLEDLRRVDKSKTKVDSSQWKEFRVGEVFEIGNTGSILAKDVHDGSGTTPYVTASYENNGVVAYVDGSAYDLIPGGCILIGGKTFSITYQERDFISNDSHNLHIRLKNRIGSKSMYLFIVAVFRSALAYKYTWGDAVIKKKLADDVVMLPATSSGNPDWNYMDQYMRNIMEESEESLRNLSVPMCNQSCVKC